MRRDARSRFRVRGSVGPSVRRSVDRTYVRRASPASSAHANRVARRPTPRTDGRSIGTDRTGSDRDALDDAKVLPGLAETNGRSNGRTTERRNAVHRDAIPVGRFRRPSSVIRHPFRSESSIESPPTIIGSRPEETEGTNGFSPEGVDLGMLFLKDDEISCVVFANHDSSKVSPRFSGFRLGYGF